MRLTSPCRAARLAIGTLPVALCLTLAASAGLALGSSVSGVAAQEVTLPGAEPERASRGRRRSRERAPRRTATPPGMQQAAPLATFGDWNVFTSGEGRARLCYAIAQPQARTPKSLARDTAYLFVTVQKGDPNRNEIAVMLGFKPKPAASQAKPGAAAAPGDPYLTLGNARYGLVVKDENAWVQNQAEEGRIVAEMARSQTTTVRTTSGRGNPTSDEYALGGFAEAIKRAREECR